MAEKAVSMAEQLISVILQASAGKLGSVTAVCAELGISRQTFYKYRKRFEAEGIEGLTPRSRRPSSCPTAAGQGVVEAVVLARKELEEEGWDNGALSVYYRLLSRTGSSPAPRTVHRILVRRGLIVPDPSKRPRSTLKRFRFPATDDCWQIDGFDHTMPDGTKVCVFQIVDDHSRFEVANLVWPAEDTAGAWKAVTTAMAAYGVPRMMLSDNGLAFTGRRLKMKVQFEVNLKKAGVRLINSKPRHPQTCGKNERLHRTVRKWLKARPPAADAAGLQAQLDEYRDRYNNERPHQSLAGATPAQARTAGVRHSPLANPVLEPAQTRVTVKVLDGRGSVQHRGTRHHFGREHAGRPVTIFDTDGHVMIFGQHVLLAEFNPAAAPEPAPPINSNEADNTAG